MELGCEDDVDDDDMDVDGSGGGEDDGGRGGGGGARMGGPPIPRSAVVFATALTELPPEMEPDTTLRTGVVVGDVPDPVREG